MHLAVLSPAFKTFSNQALPYASPNCLAILQEAVLLQRCAGRAAAAPCPACYYARLEWYSFLLFIHPGIPAGSSPATALCLLCFSGSWRSPATAKCGGSWRQLWLVSAPQCLTRCCTELDAADSAELSGAGSVELCGGIAAELS
jgi:hypothetical protein